MQKFISGLSPDTSEGFTCTHVINKLCCGQNYVKIVLFIKCNFVCVLNINTNQFYLHCSIVISATEYWCIFIQLSYLRYETVIWHLWCCNYKRPLYRSNKMSVALNLGSKDSSDVLHVHNCIALISGHKSSPACFIL